MTAPVSTHGLRRQLVTFAAIGAAGVAAYLALYTALRLALPAQVSNLTSRTTIAVVTTWANGRHTFGLRTSWTRIVGGSGVLLVVGIAISAATLAVEQAVAGHDNTAAELLTLGVATALATLVRFLLMRHWLFHDDPTQTVPTQTVPTQTVPTQTVPTADSVRSPREETHVHHSH